MSRRKKTNYRLDSINRDRLHFDKGDGKNGRKVQPDLFTIDLAAYQAGGLAFQGGLVGGLAMNTQSVGYYIQGTDGPDILSGGNGPDTIFGYAGSDHIYGLGGDDGLNGGSGDDWIYGGDGNDSLSGGDGNDYLEGGKGNDTLAGDAGNDHMYGGDGDDGLLGAAGDDKMHGGDGNDVMHGGYGDDEMYGDGGNDQMHGYWDDDAMSGGDGDDVMNGNDGNDVMDGGSGRDIMSGGNDNDRLYGGDGDDDIAGDNGDDELYGGDGDDNLFGGQGDDRLDGGAGNDYMTGQAGNDRYIYGLNYGHDTIYETITPGDRNVVKLENLNFRDVEFNASGSSSRTQDLIIRVKTTGETLTIKNALPNLDAQDRVIHSLIFDDGTEIELSRENISSYLNLTVYGSSGDEYLYAGSIYDTVIYGGDGNDNINGGSGNDRIYGEGGNDTIRSGAGDDILDGGAGNDALIGGDGNDVFVFGPGYGHDTVDATDAAADKRDVVRLTGLTIDDVDFLTTRANSSFQNLVIRIKATGETLTIANAISPYGGYNSYSIQAIEFGDGSVMEWNELESFGLLTMEGTEANNSLTASRLGTAMYGFGGNDTLYGGAGNDKIYGGEGNDYLSGQAGNDLLDGGAGNDQLDGGAGDDTYIFRAGDGVDTITNSGGGSDLLNLADLDPASLWFGKSGYHLQIGLVGTADQVTVNNWYYGDNKIDAIQAGDYAITEDQVALMVQALAAVGAPAGVDGMWTDEQREALNPIIATYWQPK